MSQQVRRELEYIPAKLEVVEHVTYVYSCRNCEGNGVNTPVITASTPKAVLPGSLVSPSLVSRVMTQKYGQGLPLYRQEQQFQSFGIDFSRQNLANWMIHGAEDWLSIIYNRMHDYLLKQDIIHADESTLQVLHEEGRTASQKSYMWLYMTGHLGPQIVLYDYRTTRANKHPMKFLSGYKGYLHTDGYAGYNNIPNVTIVGCFAQARRKFADALKAVTDKTSNSALASKEGLDYCNKLFTIERNLADLTPEDRYKKRLELSKPVLEAFSS